MKRYYLPTILILLVVFAILYFNRKKDHAINETSEQVLETTLSVPPVELVWGIPKDSVIIDTFKIRRNQNLSDILDDFGVSAYTIDRLARLSKDVFDVRYMKSGNRYYILNRDTVRYPEYMVYEKNPVDYVVFSFVDSLKVYNGVKHVDTVRQTASGVIESSLWNAMLHNGVSPVLAVELSDIYAWSIDFFGIKKGDKFKVIYDELFVDDEYFSLGAIHAAYMEHMNEGYYATHFNNAGQEGYFDVEGNSLRKAFLKAPLKYSRISSRYSLNRFHPVYKYYRPHRGVDYAAPSGTPVYSIGEGTVVRKGYQKGGGGYFIDVKHNSVYKSQYMHLKGYAKGMAPGVRVKQGQLLGYVGQTGAATGPHLDFRIYKNGHPVNPLKVKAPPVEPVSDANKPLYNKILGKYKQQLDSIPFE